MLTVRFESAGNQNNLVPYYCHISNLSFFARHLVLAMPLAVVKKNLEDHQLHTADPKV
jgi:hypothetical protein